jgi:lysozyme
MKISDEGLRLIKNFEGYHTRLKDGSCAAYLCPARVPTIGWGTTEGVKLGMVWTEAEATAALLREIAKFENAVNTSVTVEINQNEFDAMVSLAYNIGVAGFKRSSVLRRLNKGNRAGAAQAFHLWNKGGGRILAGLVSRRAREAALFLKPVEKPEEPFMPQAVECSTTPQNKAAGWGIGIDTGWDVAHIAAPDVIPAPPFGFLSRLSDAGIPTPPAELVSSVAGWQTAAETLANFARSPSVLIAVCGILIAFALPWAARRFSP